MLNISNDSPRVRSFLRARTFELQPSTSVSIPIYLWFSFYFFYFSCLEGRSDVSKYIPTCQTQVVRLIHRSRQTIAHICAKYKFSTKRKAQKSLQLSNVAHRRSNAWTARFTRRKNKK